VSHQEVRVGRVHVLLSGVMQAFYSTSRFILNQHTHNLILRCQQLLNADWWARCRRGRQIATWDLPTAMPTACGPLRDVKLDILSGFGMHHLPSVTYTIRYCNSRIEYDVSYIEAKYNIKY
jgi:hypothetical protein